MQTLESKSCYSPNRTMQLSENAMYIDQRIQKSLFSARTLGPQQILEFFPIEPNRPG